VCRDGGSVCPLGVRRRVPRGERAQEALERRLAGAAGAHRSAAAPLAAASPLAAARRPERPVRPPVRPAPVVRDAPRPPRVGRASASGFGGPPDRRRPTRSSPSGSSIVAPHLRQIPVSPLRATGPSSVSWTAPTGSWFVVKSHFG